jgi:hypothetical protein
MLDITHLKYVILLHPFFIKNDYNYTFKNTENNTKVKVIKLHRWNNACLPMEKVFVCMALYLYL